MEMTKETLTFFTPYRDVSKMMESIKKVYHLKIKQMQHRNNALDVQLMDNEEIHISYATRTGFGSLLQNQLQKFYAIVEERTCEHPQIKDNLLKQILLFQGVYVVDFYYYPQERNDKIVPLMEVADNLTALILWEMGDISNSYGDIILSSDGDCEVAIFNPIDEFSLRVNQYSLSDEQLQRMYRSTQILRYKGIYAPSHKVIPDSSSYFMYLYPEDIARRAVATMILGIYAGLLILQKWNSNKAYQYVEQMIRMYGATPFFTTSEIEFLNTGHPTDEECCRYKLSFEYCNVMLWALGLIEQLYFPGNKCNDSIIVQAVLNFYSIDKIVEASHLRSRSELMDELDLIERYELACTYAKTQGFPIPAALDKEVILYRHHALKYLISNEEANWDEVNTSIQMINLI